MDVHDTRFQPLHNAIDNVFGESRLSGVGSEEKSAEFFTKEDENNLWAREVTGICGLSCLMYYCSSHRISWMFHGG